MDADWPLPSLLERLVLVSRSLERAPRDRVGTSTDLAPSPLPLADCGTLFMATEESYIHDNIKKAILQADELQTTHVFSTLHNTARVFKSVLPSLLLPILTLPHRNKVAVQVVSMEKRPGGVTFPEIAPVRPSPSPLPN